MSLHLGKGTAPKVRRYPKNNQTFTWQQFILPIVLLIIWQMFFELGLIRSIVLPPPSTVMKTIGELLQNGQLFKHLGFSLIRVLEGFSLAVLFGLTLGIAMGLFRNVYLWLDMLIQVLRPIPPIAWIPLAILWFGIDEMSKIFIIFLGAFFPILINVIEGISQTDHKFVEVAKVLEISRLKFTSKIVLPGALPSIMTGLRVGLGFSWMCVVAAELIAGTEGIGYMIMDARQLAQTDVVLVGMLTIGITGKCFDYMLKALERKLLRWKTTYQGA
ncbi:ABC transporter permease [Heliophilum fasciatum]|uniref:Sulfonate transport system permease protein n=1 Tax=Heliophilum fasciatum TaxID=35700 RepID=A0A4R2RUL6_9FIRM|nr:ABC transporter permease [Heliophilum fasciatum]MCW2278500.1 sulfonate transport system permease protein [Heliophilum fasciatum]TCP63631.1 sulfonate transport system permease protein [Heliophilum fasciatum]